MPTVSQAKELQGWTPLLLAVFTFQVPSGTQPTLQVATHALNAAEGGPSFPGIGILPSGDYLGRISQHDIDALQQRSQLGIDRFAKITVHLLDADHYIWSNYVSDVSGNPKYGFRGATLQLALVMWQVGTTNFSSDAPILFAGTCDQEVVEQGLTSLAISANNSHNTATVKLPLFPIQNRCPLYFPQNAAERTLAADPASTFCPYCPDISAGIGPLGNTTTANLTDANGAPLTDSAGIYVQCDFIRSNPADAHSGCMARLGNAATTSVAPDGDIAHDHSGRHTGAFAGVQWSPGTYYAYNRNYTSGQKIATFSYFNSAILGQYQNLLYGTQWVNPKLANIIEDGNATKMEAMICIGDIGLGGVQKVIVNGIEVPYQNGDVQLTWRWVNTGGRLGQPSTDTGYSNSGHSALGDPYGSIACIEIVVYKDIFTGFGTPTVQVIASGPQLWVFSDQTTKALQGAPANYNPWWVLLDVMTKANWKYPEVDMSTWIAQASFAAASIDYFTQTGTTSSHPRFQCMFSLEQQKSAAEVIQGIMRCANGYVSWGQNGLLQGYTNQTLADSQTAPITGSNYNTGVASIHADNTAGTGYVAYSFDESNIARVKSGNEERPDIEFEDNATVTTPNKIYIRFQDQDNQFVVDSLGEVDQDATIRAGGALQPGGSVVSEELTVIGSPNFDQSVRIANTYMAERQRGNGADDPRGTDTVTFGTSVKCEHLRAGHIIFLSWGALGWSKLLFRVIKIAPKTDYFAARITASRLNEVWYTDLYGQAPQALYSETNRSRPQRVPLPWQAFAELPNVPAAGGTIFSPKQYSFELAEVDIQGQTGDNSTLVQLQIGGVAPINQASTRVGPPIVPIQASVSNTGGSLKGGASGLTLIFQLTAQDAGGVMSAPSQTIMATIPPGVTTASVTINGIGYQSGTAGLGVYAGTDSLNITHQQDVGLSSSITFTGDGTDPVTGLMAVATFGPPDLAATTIYAQAASVQHAGIFADQVGAVDSTSITIGGEIAALQSLAGYPLFLLGRQTDTPTNLPIIEFTIASNSGANGYQFVVDRDPSALIQILDLVCVGCQANISSATTIGDANFVTPFAPAGVNALDIGYEVVIVKGTGRYQRRTITDVSTDGTTYTVSRAWTTIPDSTSIFIVVESGYRYNAQSNELSNNTSANLTDPLLSMNIGNYQGHTLLVQCLTGDSIDQTFSSSFRSPFRMLYVWGAGEGQQDVTSTPFQVLPSHQVLTLKSGAAVLNLPSQVNLGRKGLKILNRAGASVVVNAAAGETIEGGSALAIADGASWTAYPKS